MSPSRCKNAWVERNADFRRAVEASAVDLAGWSQEFSDAHVHFDHPRFAGLVPEFTDPEWVRVAPVAADVLSLMPGDFLVYVPLDQVEEFSDAFQLDSLTSLRPWEPPSIHLLRSGSAFEMRGTHSPGAWFRDLAPSSEGARGWISSYRADDEPVCRLSLMYETLPA
jgi:hypothetical protein